MRCLNCLVKPRFIAILYLSLLALCFPVIKALAEGSKEVNANGGSRAFLISGTLVNESVQFPTFGTMKVYAKAGETINAGSSVQGNGSGTINMRSPNGNTYTSGASATTGLIANYAQEQAGPLPNTGGYTPFTRTVSAAEAGVWEIDFIPQNGGNTTSANVTPILANANWVQPTGMYIAAFDVSVRNTANTAFIPGRVYTNVFEGMLGAFDVGFNGIFRVLTKDGYQYILDNNGQAGNAFTFFVNNKGFRNTDGTASYKSINSIISPNIQDPRAADTPTDITYKIFFNSPAADLPATANVPGGATTWLLNPVAEPTLTNYQLTGKEGVANKVGTSPLGATMAFTSNKNGTYLIAIDIDKNGSFIDAIDRKLTGTVVSGLNQASWDGLDGLGKKVASGSYSSNLNVVLYGGEVHFPFFDVERNAGGLKLTRNNGFMSPDFTVYWDDTPIIQSGTASVPIANTVTGSNSQTAGHRWGTAGATPVDFGDQRGLDTWAYIAATPLVATATFQVSEADLEVAAITTTGVSGSCAGQTISYAITVKNNGPDNVTGSKFSFAYPAGLTDAVVTSTATIGLSAINTEAVSATAYSTNLDIANGAVRTFIVAGKVPLTANTFTVTASVLRPADVTDPDATNPDVAAPTDALLECNSAPSGVGCNNIKTNTLTFLTAPSAIAGQIVTQDATITLTDVSPGTWSQSGATPGAVAITAPAALSTTITGLKNVGTYHILRTNAAGCIADIAINVISSALNIPNIMTPNGDGKNDTFAVPDILLFPGSELIIVNRWGNEVYHSKNYKNTWSGDGLSEGTYYYVLNKKDASGSITTYKGWVFLKR